MRVFAFWNGAPDAPPRQAELVSLWVRHCVANGDTPFLLTARDAIKSWCYKRAIKPVPSEALPLYALRAKRGKKLVSLLKYAS